jgi:uncharacterized Zn finger protein (UPF0148 family)
MVPFNCPKHGVITVEPTVTGRLVCPKCAYSELLDRTLRQPESKEYEKVAKALIEACVWGIRK